MRSKKFEWLAAWAFTALAAFGATGARAAFPDHPVRMEIGFPPGGGNDLVGRIVAARLGERLAQTVVVENRSGAAGDIAAEFVAHAPADGYTVLLMPNTTVISAAMSTRPLAYDVRHDFAPLALLSVAPMVLVANAQGSIRSFDDFMRQARAHPGQINHGTAGVGTLAYLSAEWFEALTGLSITAVPYRGTGPALTGLLSGEVQVMFTPLSSVDAYLRDGKVRLLAQMGAQRLSAYPDVPTILESGVKTFDVSLWYGLVAPHGTPDAVVRRYQTALREVLADPAVSRDLAARGAPAAFAPAAAFGQLMRDDIVRWSAIGQRVKGDAVK